MLISLPEPGMRNHSLTTMSILVISALGAPMALAQAPQGPLPAQDTPPLTRQQKCSIPEDPENQLKIETEGRVRKAPSQDLSATEGTVCPPPDVNPNMSVMPPGAGKPPEPPR